MNHDEPTEWRAMFIILTKAPGGCDDDDGATAIATLGKITLNTFSDLGLYPPDMEVEPVGVPRRHRGGDS